MGAKYLEAVKQRLHAIKQWSPNEIRVWQVPFHDFIQMSTYWMNVFPNETNSLWFDTWFLPFYITCDSVHLLINFAIVVEAKQVFGVVAGEFLSI